MLLGGIDGWVGGWVKGELLRPSPGSLRHILHQMTTIASSYVVEMVLLNGDLR
jgi:hypothetical protein